LPLSVFILQKPECRWRRRHGGNPIDELAERAKMLRQHGMRRRYYTTR